MRHRHWRVVLASTVVAVMAAGCTAAPPAATPTEPGAATPPAAPQTPVTTPDAPSAPQAGPLNFVSTAPTNEPDHAFYTLGASLGFYDQLGVDVEVGQVAGSTLGIQLTASNEVQLAHSGMAALIVAMNAQPDLPVVAVYQQDVGNLYEILVPVDSDIQAVADLKDRNIGVASLASGALPNLRAMLVDGGLNPDTDVGLIPVGVGAQALAALESGRVDALSLFRGAHAVLENFGVEFRKFQKELPSGVLVVNSNYLNSNRDDVVAFLQGIILGTTYSQACPEETLEIYWSEQGGPPSDISREEAVSRGVHLINATAELQKQYDDDSRQWGEMRADEWDAVQTMLVEQNQIDDKVDPGLLYTNELIDAINEVDIAPAMNCSR